MTGTPSPNEGGNGPPLPELSAPRGINRLGGWRSWALLPVWGLLHLWWWTLRFQLSGEEARRLSDIREPTLLLFWHQHLFSTAYLYRRHRRARRTCGLISASKDGAWLEAVFSLAGIYAVRGSSSFRGGPALRELVGRFRQGFDIAITPDGPQGPRYSFKPGAALAVDKTGARALLVHYQYARFWRLGSWDGFFLPQPFSRVKIYTRMVSAEEMPTESKAKAEFLREELLRLKEKAMTDSQKR